MFPNLEEIAVTLGLVWGVWQGILLWKGERRATPGETQTPEKIVNQLG